MKERLLLGDVREHARREDFDPIAEGDRHGLSREVSAALWERARWETTSRDGVCNEQAARTQFTKLTELAGKRGGRLGPAPFHWTQVDAVSDRVPPDIAAATRVPGRTTRVLSEAHVRVAEGTPGRTTLAASQATSEISSPDETRAFFQRYVRGTNAAHAKLERAITERDYTAAVAAMMSMKHELRVARHHLSNGLAEDAELSASLAALEGQVEPLFARLPHMSAGGHPRDLWGSSSAEWRAATGHAAQPEGSPEVGARVDEARAPERLPASLHSRLADVFGRRFDHVELHRDSVEVRAGQRAVTRGHHIHLERGADLTAPRGELVIAHELGHVAQQDSRGARPGTRQELEREASQAATQAMRGQTARISLRAEPTAVYAFSEDDEHDGDGAHPAGDTARANEVAHSTATHLPEVAAADKHPLFEPTTHQDAAGDHEDSMLDAVPAEDALPAAAQIVGGPAAKPHKEPPNVARIRAERGLSELRGVRPDQLGPVLGRATLIERGDAPAEQARASRHTPGRATLIERGDAPANEASPPAHATSPPAHATSPPAHVTSPPAHEASRRALASLPARLPGATIHRLFAGPAQRGATAQARTVAASAGQPLDGATRTWAEAAFGYDFGGVAVHTSSDAAQAAEALGARAFTLGNSIVFGQGHYDPSSPAGRKLLAHELTHIVQQRGTADAPIAPPAPRAIASQLATASLAHLASLEQALAGPDARAAADAQLGSVELVLATLRSLVGIAAVLHEPGLAGGAYERLRAAAQALAAWLGTTSDDDAHVALRALGGGAPAPEALEVSDPADPAEREAEHVADAVMRGESIAIGAHAPAARAHRTHNAAPGAYGSDVDPIQLMLAIAALVGIISAVVWKLLPQTPAAVPAPNAQPAATKPAAASSSKSTPKNGSKQDKQKAKYEQQQVQHHRVRLDARIAELQQQLQAAAAIDANIHLHAAHVTVTYWLASARALLAQTEKTQTQQAWWPLYNALPPDQALRQAVDALSIHVAIQDHGPQLTNARVALATLPAALQQYDAAHHNNRVQTTIVQIDTARASEAGLTAHTVAAYQANATQIVAAAAALLQRFQTAQPGLFAAAPALGMPTVLAVIHEAFIANLGLAGAELALGFAQVNGLEATLAHLIANFQFRASLVGEAQRQNATPAQLAALQNFQPLGIIAPNVQIQIPIIANETLTDAQRTAALHWAHFLDPHCYACATAATLRNRQDPTTSMWPQGTTAALVAQHMQTAVNAHPRLATLRAAIEHKVKDPFDRSSVLVAAPNLWVQIGTKVGKGRLKITQFFPIRALGNGVDQHDLPTTHLLGNLLAHRA